MSLFTAGDQMDEYERRDAHPPHSPTPPAGGILRPLRGMGRAFS